MIRKEPAKLNLYAIGLTGFRLLMRSMHTHEWRTFRTYS